MEIFYIIFKKRKLISAMLFGRISKTIPNAMIAFTSDNAGIEKGRKKNLLCRYLVQLLWYAQIENGIQAE